MLTHCHVFGLAAVAEDFSVVHPWMTTCGSSQLVFENGRASTSMGNMAETFLSVWKPAVLIFYYASSRRSEI